MKSNKISLGSLLVILISILAFSQGYAQLSVSPTNTATTLANALVGPGIVISNATLTCPSNGGGTFSGGTTTSKLAINNGIVLTTGFASSVSASDATFASDNRGGSGDVNLNALSGNPTHDACVLQFDFVPSGDAVTFHYQFGSEEYPNFTCTQFNDVFGFFISGGTEYPTPTNLALVPNTSIPVAINSVNGGSATGNGNIATCNAMGSGSPFPAYFINNVGHGAPVYDGLTTLLTASANVTPCATYHLKLGVADGTDFILDSGVFLESGSLTVNPPTIVGCPGDINKGTGAGAPACGTTVTWTPPTAANNCLNVTSSSTHNPGDFFPVVTTPITYTFTNAGGSSTCTFNVTVTDNTQPVIQCPGAVTINCQDNSSPSNTGTATATDNCAVMSIISSDVSTQVASIISAGHYNYTISRTWTATDNHSNSSSCVQVITVRDVTAPNAICKPTTVTLSGGAASITPADVNNGSNDNCSPISLSVSPSTFSCADAGLNVPVVLTVTDVSGNVSKCTTSVAVVGIVPSCAVSVTPCNNVYTGGVATDLYLGYGPQCATIKSNPTGGSSFTYVWTGPTGYLSCTTCQSPVFTPTIGGTYTFTSTVTNNFGCSATCSVTFCVKDIRDPNHANKVNVCHVPPGNPNNPQNLSISVNAVPSHLGNHTGDRLGECGQTCGAPVNARLAFGNNNNGSNPDLQVMAYPNPFNEGLHVQVLSNVYDAVQVTVTDLAGRKLEVLQAQPTRTDFTIGRELAPGIYMIEVKNGDASTQVKVVKTK